MGAEISGEDEGTHRREVGSAGSGIHAREGTKYAVIRLVDDRLDIVGNGCRMVDTGSVGEGRSNKKMRSPC